MSEQKPSIADLEAALAADAEEAIDILPDGTVMRRERPAAPAKPLTFKAPLGGEY